MDVKLLKLASPVISKSAYSVIDSSSENGIVKDDLKKARETSVYKNEDEINDGNNFRPILVIILAAKMIVSSVSKPVIQ